MNPLEATAPPRPEAALEFARSLVAEQVAVNPVLMFSNGRQVALVPSEAPPRTTLEALVLLVESGRIRPVTWALLISDTYCLDTGPEEDPEQYGGRLAELFAAGDARVTEAVVAILMAPDGPSYCVQQRYTRTDRPDGAGATVDWGRVDELSLTELDGNLVRGLRRVVAARAGG